MSLLVQRDLDVLTQRAAQAARCGSLEVLQYLIASYGVDENAFIQTWHSQDTQEGVRLVLINTALSRLMREAQMD